MKHIVIIFTVIILSMHTASSFSNEQQSRDTSITELINNNGDSLYTTLYPNPNKETVILLHGGPGFPSDLTAVVQALKEQYQIITFHQRGTSKSPCKSGDYSMAVYVLDIHVIAQHYNITKFHLFGHSWGGLYAQIYAQQYPEHLLSLFLCSPAGGTNTDWDITQDEVLQYNKSKCSWSEWMMMGINSGLGILGSNSGYKRLFKQVMINYNPEFVNPDSFVVDYNNLEAEAINKTLKEISKYPLLSTMPSPTFPITIVFGDKDIYQTSKNFVIARYITAHVYTITNCGHMPWLHNPKEYSIVLAQHYTL